MWPGAPWVLREPRGSEVTGDRLINIWGQFFVPEKSFYSNYWSICSSEVAEQNVWKSHVLNTSCLRVYKNRFFKLKLTVFLFTGYMFFSIHYLFHIEATICAFLGTFSRRAEFQYQDTLFIDYNVFDTRFSVSKSALQVFTTFIFLVNSSSPNLLDLHFITWLINYSSIKCYKNCEKDLKYPRRQSERNDQNIDQKTPSR